MKILNKMKSEDDLLCFGETIWLDALVSDDIIALKRVFGGREMLFIGNTQKHSIRVDTADILNHKKCILSNGEHKIENGILHLAPYEYVVFE